MSKEDFETKSRSQHKRESEALQRLGEKLVELPDAVLAALPLPDALREAIAFARTLTSHGAQRRQRQFIGRLMREIDAEPISQAVAQWESGRQRQSDHHHDLETLREDLIREGEPAVKRLLAIYPQAEAGQLRQLVNNARQERQSDAPPRASRALFRYLRELGEVENEDNSDGVD